MTEFLYTIETPSNFEDGSIEINDLDKANDLAFDLHLEHGYSCVRCNISGEIVADYGDIMPLIDDYIV